MCSYQVESPFRETLGEYLRREREARAVSLTELSRGTRISHPYLEAIERNDFSSIPRQDFIPGFLRGYSRQIGLNTEDVLRRYYFQCEWAGRKESFQQLSLFDPPAVPPKVEKEEIRPEPIPAPSKKKRSRRSIIIQLVIILAAVGIGLYLQYLTKQNGGTKKAPPAVSAEPSGQRHEEGGAKGGS